MTQSQAILDYQREHDDLRRAILDYRRENDGLLRAINDYKSNDTLYQEWTGVIVGNK